MTRKKFNKRNNASHDTNLVKLAEVKTILPADGTAVELPLPEGIEAFISEEGKLMLHKKSQEPDSAADNSDITYKEIAKKLFLDKETYFSDGFDIKHVQCNNPLLAQQEDNATSEAQVRKQVAFTKLLNIASYLNGGWTPSFGNFEKAAYAIGYNRDGKILPIACYSYNVGVVLFPSPYICQQAIRIMGEKSIHDLLNYDY